MSAYEIWSVESRLKCPNAVWIRVHLPWEKEDMDEQQADKVIALYERAMPSREYRKTSFWYDPSGLEDDDIPF